MSTPFAADTARKAAAPQYTAKPPDPWSTEVRLHLSALRRRAIERGEWTGPRFSLPEPCWRVTDAHSITQQKLYLALQAIGEGRYNRPKTGAAAAIKGQKNASGKPFDYDVWVSHRALAWIAPQEAIRLGLGRDPTPLKIGTVRDGMRQLATKHSIVPSGLRRIRGDDRRDEKGHCVNRDATFYRVPHWDAVLEARRNDAAIATTHGNVNWTNGRANSRRLLSPEEASVWGLAELPARQKRAASEATTAHAAPAGEAVAETAQQPVKQPVALSPRRGASQRRIELLREVPPDQQERIDQLCAKTPDARWVRRKGSYTERMTELGSMSDYHHGRLEIEEPPIADLAGEMLAKARATAAITGREFPADGIAELCERIFEKARELQIVQCRDEESGGYKYERDVFVWKPKVGMPAAYLRECCNDQAVVLRLLDNRERAAKREAAEAEKKNRELWEKVASCLQQLRKSPSAVSLLQWSDDLNRAHPDLYMEVWREDDRRHGGDGEGASWDNTPLSIHKKPAVERTFADALESSFLNPEDERPPPAESA